MARHRVTPAGNSLRRFEDPAHSSDPQIRSLVAALSTVEIAPPPRAHFRAELRAQLVAVTPRLVTEGPLEDANARASVATAQTQRSAVASAIAGLRSLHLGRPLGVAVAAFTLFAALIGGAVFLSNKALPGDSLYGVKRASENARLSMSSGVQRGKIYTEFATHPRRRGPSPAGQGLRPGRRTRRERRVCDQPAHCRSRDEHARLGRLRHP